MLAAPNWAGADTDVLFIMVEFTDLGCAFTPAQMQTNMFGGGASGPGDLDDYYDEISYGDLALVGTVVGDGGGTADCVNLANNRAFYNNNVANPDGDDDLVREALADIDAAIDFADYDNNGDGRSMHSGSSMREADSTTAARRVAGTPTTSGRTRWLGGGQAVDGARGP